MESKNKIITRLDNETTKLHLLAKSSYCDLFETLMHLKVMRAYIDGVLRFGVRSEFLIAVLCPRRGREKQLLKEMSDVLAEDTMREMYGEKIEGGTDNEDFWPFVSIPLTSPAQLFKGEWSNCEYTFL